MNKFLYANLLLLTISVTAFAQKYGNEWIDYSLKYSKITVNRDDLYKITFNEAVSKNLSSGKLDPKKFQLFNKGAEVPIFISGDQDGSFDQGDELFFYGSKNDASLDKIFYANTDDLPNSDISLFTDNNYYFLTYNPNKNGLRYEISSLSKTNLTPEPFIVVKERLNFDTSYYPGEYILDVMTLSEYIAGEGYLGATISKGQSLNYQLNTPSFINTGYQSKLSFYVAGRSNASSTNSFGRNHHFRVSNNSTPLFDSLYRGYATIRKVIPFEVTSNTTNLTLSSVDDLGAVTDFQAPGYLQIQYGRNLNINGVSNLSFSLDNTKALHLLSFTNVSIGNPIILEKQGLNAYVSSGSNSFVIKGATTIKDYYLADQNTATEAKGDVILFKNINSASSRNYLIISHKSLQTGAESYQQYNQSISMPTSLVYTDDLYNEFYYGFHHSMAIRNYCQYMIEKGSVKPEYLLLLGKGHETPKNSLDKDLVPTMGFPASDNMLTSGFNGSLLEPGLNTGRVPAKNNAEVVFYLEKLRSYNNLPNEIWRKNILQLTGGTSVSESNSFRNYQKQFFDHAKKLNFGGHLSKILKDVSTPITENQTERIIKETKEGLSLISYLGHGSATGTEISFGKAEDQQNTNRPTVYIVNGCSTGACFSDTKSLGELFVLVKDVAAIGWIGTTSEGVASYLSNATNNFYQNWFTNLYGKSISEGIREGLKKSQNPNDKLNRAHTRQYIWLGDPAIKFYSPKKQDFALSDNSVFPTVPQQNATAQTLQLSFIVKNLGKTTNDSIPVQITRTLPNGLPEVKNSFKIKPIYNQDTLTYKLDNVGLNVAGNNKIDVKLDPLNQFDEISKLNNTSTIEIFLPGNGVKPLFPLENGIYSKQNLVLRGQPDNLNTKGAEYLFEIDSVSNFNSGFKKTSNIITAGIFPTWKPVFTLEKGKVYFWRIRLNLPIDQGGSWSNSSFTYLPDVNDGFSQAHKAQFENFKKVNITYDNSNGKFEFGKSFFPSSIYTEGDDGVDGKSKRFRTDQAVSFSNALFDGITLVAMSNFTPNKFLNYPSPFNSTNGPKLAPNGYTGQFYWNVNNPSEIDSLIKFINQIPDKFHVIGFNGRNASFKTLPLAAKNALKTFGLSKFDLVGNGEPYMFWGIKGQSSGEALEFTSDYSSPIPPRQQTLQYFNELEFPLSNGTISVNKIGPSQEWKKAYINYDKNVNDIISHDIYGVTANGGETKIINSTNASEIDLSAIDAKKFPYLKISSNISDQVDYDFPNLKSYIVDYKPMAEASIDTDLINVFSKSKIEEGDSIKWELGITNIYDYDIKDSLNVSYTLLTEDNTSIVRSLKKLPPLAAGKSTVVKITESTIDLVGKNSVTIRINFDDLYAFNNEIGNTFEVLGDKKEPLVSVLFDGKNITSGEIVSSKPIITIDLSDENKYLLLNDTSLVNVYLKKETDTDFKRIAFSDKLMTFKASTSSSNNKSIIEFIPQFNTDGLYTLKVKSKDKSGNSSVNDFEIDFEIITESSITNFYPYPNPVVNSMRFVYTLTGYKIPDKIKIDIYTPTGRVVRTVSKTELGNIRIGNNVSDFVWDCTDEFGDRLANGVYFYKVTTSDTEENFKIRPTKSDKYFKNNIGKIYLIR